MLNVRLSTERMDRRQRFLRLGGFVIRSRISDSLLEVGVMWSISCLALWEGVGWASSRSSAVSSMQSLEDIKK